MKKTFILATLLASGFIARAETLKVHIPVAYATTGTMLPAGDYSVSPINGSSTLFLFQSDDVKAFVFARLVPAIGTKPLSLEIAKDKTMGMQALAQAFALSPTKKK